MLTAYYFVNTPFAVPHTDMRLLARRIQATEDRACVMNVGGIACQGASRAGPEASISSGKGVPTQGWAGAYFFRTPLYGPFDFLWSSMRPVLVSSFTYRPVTGFLTCTRSLTVPARDPVPVFLAIGALTDSGPPVSARGLGRPGN